MKDELEARLVDKYDIVRFPLSQFSARNLVYIDDRGKIWIADNYRQEATQAVRYGEIEIIPAQPPITYIAQGSSQLVTGSEKTVRVLDLARNESHPAAMTHDIGNVGACFLKEKLFIGHSNTNYLAKGVYYCEPYHEPEMVLGFENDWPTLMAADTENVFLLMHRHNILSWQPGNKPIVLVEDYSDLPGINTVDCISANKGVVYLAGDTDSHNSAVWAVQDEATRIRFYPSISRKDSITGLSIRTLGTATLLALATSDSARIYSL